MVECDFASNGAADFNYFQFAADRDTVFDFSESRRFRIAKRVRVRENCHGKTLRIRGGRPRMIRVGHDYSNDRRSVGNLAELRFEKWNWIDKVEACRGRQSGGKELGFYRRIERLPNPNLGLELMDFGGEHDGRVPEIRVVARRGIIGA